LCAKEIGYCKLTGHYGQYVKAHILPQALTRASISGEPLTETSIGEGFKRKWSSWYDRRLVTRQGEELLAALDDSGIRELRNSLLVWSSWTCFRPHFETFSPTLPAYSFRLVRLADPMALKRFFLSIAWRAAASDRPEMRFVQADASRVERLRKIVVGDVPVGARELPLTLIQLSTNGPAHNLTPITGVKSQSAYGSKPEKRMEIVRVYVDGLICHMHWESDDFEYSEGNELIIGGADKLLVLGVEFSASAQYENLLINSINSLI
jgi:hypothetical protein